MTPTTELQIAKTFIIGLNSKDKLVREQFRHECVMHKSSCQRFLEWFDKEYGDNPNKFGDLAKHLNDKITDLKSVIKEYEKNGI